MQTKYRNKCTVTLSSLYTGNSNSVRVGMGVGISTLLILIMAVVALVVVALKMKRAFKGRLREQGRQQHY